MKQMQNKNTTLIRILFAVRVCLWAVALVSTVYWIWFSFRLYLDGIFDYHNYATIMRPVLYTGLVISFAAIGLSFALRALSVKLRGEQ